jgi:hypothetical protein
MKGFGLTKSRIPDSTEDEMLITIDDSTPWVAAGDGDLELLKRALITLNMSVNTADTNGFSFVHASAAYNQIAVLKWLIHQEGCNVNVQDSDGDTPLHHCDRLEAAKMLVEEGGADVCLKNNDGMTALQLKVEDLKALELDEELDIDDEDYIELKKLVEYLKNYEKNPQE